MNDMNLLKPIAVFEQLFEKQIRLENRRNDEHATFSVAVNVLQSCHGSSLVRVGNTEVLCGAKVKVLPDVVDAGSIVCNVELNSLANRSIHPNTGVTKEAQFLSSSLQRLVTNVVCPNAAKELHIYAEDNPNQPIGSYVIKLDIVVLHDDGCLLDACVPAALATLLSLSWSKISSPTTENNDKCSSKQYKQQVPTVMQTLPVSDWPVALSFCCIPLIVARRSGISPVICQPSRRELALWDTDAGPGYVTLSCNSGKVLELSMTNAFLPSLAENLTNQQSNADAKGSSVWRLLFDLASAYASEVKTAIDAAINKVSAH